MKRITTGAGIALLALALGLPTAAHAALQLDIGFDPEAACPGETVRFFFSLENVGDTNEIVQYTVVVRFGNQQIGPFPGRMPLAAGEEVAREIQFRIPPPTPAGTLTVTVTATDSDGTVEDVATLEVLQCRGNRGGQGNANKILNQMSDGLREIGLR